MLSLARGNAHTPVEMLGETATRCLLLIKSASMIMITTIRIVITRVSIPHGTHEVVP